MYFSAPFILFSPPSISCPFNAPRAANSRASNGTADVPIVRVSLQASIRRARHGGQWPLIWRRRTTSRGYKERQDSPDLRPVPRASCRPIPPLYLIPRPSRPTSPVSVSSNTIDVGARDARETSAFVRYGFNPRSRHPRSPFRISPA